MLKFYILSYIIIDNYSQSLPQAKTLIIKQKCYLIFEPENSKRNNNMEIINIEACVFESMATRFEQFVKRVETLCGREDKSLQKWLDNQEVCQLLNISKRTFFSWNISL